MNLINISNCLIAIFCAFPKLGFGQTYHRAIVSQQVPDYHTNRPKPRVYFNMAAPNDNYHYDQQQQNFNDLHLEELTESAKDPKNLKNGIYHDGAVTYDLGLPHFEILNPHDPPEIITSDHPHYKEELSRIKKSKNYTFEDYGLTPQPESDTISETTTFEVMTTTDSIFTSTDRPETETTAATDSYILMPTTITTTTTPSPIRKDEYKHLKSRIEKHLNKTKGKLRNLSAKTEVRNKNHKIPATLDKSEAESRIVVVRKSLKSKQKPAPFRITHTNLKSENSPQLLDRFERFYGQSVVLPLEQVPSSNVYHLLKNLRSETVFASPT